MRALRTTVPSQIVGLSGQSNPFEKKFRRLCLTGLLRWHITLLYTEYPVWKGHDDRHGQYEGKYRTGSGLGPTLPNE